MIFSTNDPHNYIKHGSVFKSFVLFPSKILNFFFCGKITCEVMIYLQDIKFLEPNCLMSSFDEKSEVFFK